MNNMKRIELKYGSDTLEIEVPERNIIGEVRPVLVEAPNDSKRLIRDALDNPIGSKSLSEIANNNDSVAIVVDDITRACPNHLMLPLILDELKRSGIKDEGIKIILALGTHRAMTVDEIVRRLGRDIADRFKVINHSQDEINLISIGKTSRGNEVKINRQYIESKIKIFLGDVNYHYYAGYGGGRKSLLPGISGFDTINFNHQMLFNPNARAGILEGNPVHEDMVEACELAPPDFILNVVLNHEKQIIGAFSGNWRDVFKEAVKFLDKYFRVRVNEKADIVITSAGGYPKDMNLYQGYKALDNARMITKKGGVVVAFLKCEEGIGQDVFNDWMKRFKEPEEIKTELQKGFVMGAHKAYYLLNMEKDMNVILYSSLDGEMLQEDFGLIPAMAPKFAIEEALSIVGENATILILPYGYDTLPILDTDTP